MTKDESASRLKIAAHWYAELREPDADHRTWDKFRAWEGSDPANRAAFQQVEASLSLLEGSSLAAPGAGNGYGSSATQSASRKPARVRLYWLTGIAAVLVLAVVSVVTFSPPSAPVAQVYATAIGDTRDVTLEDGSRVTLNTDTELAVTYTDSERRIQLAHGQALFSVMKGTRPFIVAAGGSETRALGTRFEVYRGPDDVAVTLVEGSVSVLPETAGQGSAAPDVGEERAATVLVPGDRLVLRGGAIASLTQVDTSEALAWQSGILQFRDVTLGEAIAELNRYSETKIRVDDPALAQERLSGAFAAGDQDTFAETLKLYLPVAVHRKDKIILIASAGRVSP
ncbi:FecR family protein [Hyphomonas oceanitis]|uniref:Transcriptional regulator n=1 Tax=Hyphomonas oceanitis SCH89 TaxID=1280953 RepID=A0A059G5Y5_9PROT|nr:FecR domain-containing protein [Hyphomonas oceanitis]KDA01863.1 transcriptional regulator [Hyphomonas oceanitis SCH89]